MTAEELAAPWARLWRGPPSTACLSAFCFTVTFSLLLSQPQTPKAAKPRPSHSSQFNSFPDTPSPFPRHCYHPQPSLGAETGSQPHQPHGASRFPRKTQATSGPKQDVPRLHFGFIPKGPNSLPVSGNMLKTGLLLE